MKNLKSIFVIVPLLIVGSVMNVSAQKKLARTASVRAAYGQSPAPTKHKTKKIKKAGKRKQYIAHQNKQAKAARERKLASRKKNNWAG